MAKKLNLDFLVPLIVVAIFALFNLLGLFASIDNRVYDGLLHVKRDAREDPSILLVDVDDLSISKVGVWPWSRDVMADGLVTMRELGAAYATFDIQYVDPSPRGVDARYLERDIPKLFDQQFATLNDNTTALFQAIESGSISLADAQDYVKQLSGMTDVARKLLLDKVQAIARDNDLYLGQAAWFFHRAFFTVNFFPDVQPLAADYEQWVLEHVAIPNVVVRQPYGHMYKGISPAIQPVLTRAAGAGFPLVIVDGDGVRRRVELVLQYKDHYFGQLVFRPLLDYLGNPEVDLYRTRIVLRDAKIPGEKPHDISIPLTRRGDFLINWPKRQFAQSFRHISYYSLVLYQNQEDALLTLLRGMAAANYLSFLPDGAGFFASYDAADQLRRTMLDGGDPAQIEQYRALRTTFFERVGAFLGGDTEKQILAQIDAALATPGITNEQSAQFRAVRDDVAAKFKQTRDIFGAYQQNRATLEKQLANAFCIIGNTATSTTDLGTNPFQESYPNVGTHASVANTILTERFITALPSWYSLVLAVLLTVALFLAIRRLEPLPSILIGFGFVVAFVAAGALLFALSRIYVELTTPTFALLVTFIVLTVVKFLAEAREKSFIRNAFGRYLSGDVINELLADPDKLALGGEKRMLTAAFTDVRGFSTISEQLDPADLVKLLNSYLTAMSDIILEYRGTIDKYEGDAIIAFYGAPILFEDHAKRACFAAARMKRAEKELNERFIAEQLSPSPLVTRIGVNTGEMVVGNMGTANKMDYTIMGNAVNLASRLEGVNKQYGTWVLVSEATRAAAADGFLFRTLDRVRVVGIQQPVRLYELVEESAVAPKNIVDAVELFHEGLRLFEARDWTKARSVFTEILELRSDDGPARVFLKRCEEYEKTPPPANWDGVFNLAIK